MKKELNKDKATFSTIKIEEYVYEKVKKSDVTINIPQEPIFFQEDNYETVVGLFPQFATWSDNSVWEIQIIEVTDKSILKTMVRTNPTALSDIVSRFEVKNKTQEDYLRDKVVRYLKDFFNDDRTSREDFLSKYNYFLREVWDVVGL